MKKITISTLFIAAVSLLHGQSWKTFYTAPKTGEKTQLVEGPKGEIYFGYREFQGGKITVKKYYNGTWSNVGDTAFSYGTSSGLKLVIDADSMPVIMYSDVNKNWDLTVMKFNGIKWDTLGNRGFSKLGYGDFNMASVGGHLFAASQIYNQIKVWYYDTASKSWTVMGSNGLASVGFPGGVEMHGIGNYVYVAYRDNNSRIYVRRADASQPSGSATWSTIQGFFNANGMSNLGLRMNDFSGTPFVTGYKTTGNAQVSFYYNFGWLQMSDAIPYAFDNFDICNGQLDTFPLIALRDKAGYGRVYRLNSQFGFDSFGTSSLFDNNIISANDKVEVLYTRNRRLFVAYQENGTSKLIIKEYCPSVNGFSITNQGLNVFCSADGTTLSVNAMGSLQWLKNDQPMAGKTGKTLFVNETGSYKVKIINSCGDSGVTAAVSLTARTTPQPTIIENGNTLETQSYASYQWYQNGSMVSPNGQNRTLSPSSGGVFKVSVSTDFCTGESPDYSWWPLSAGKSAITEFNIYPNPSTAMVNIRTSGKTELAVTDMNGKLIWKGFADGFVSIPTNEWSAGVYSIRSSDGVVARIVKN